MFKNQNGDQKIMTKNEARKNLCAAWEPQTKTRKIKLVVMCDHLVDDKDQEAFQFRYPPRYGAFDGRVFLCAKCRSKFPSFPRRFKKWMSQEAKEAKFAQVTKEIQ